MGGGYKDTGLAGRGWGAAAEGVSSGQGTYAGSEGEGGGISPHPVPPLAGMAVEAAAELLVAKLLVEEGATAVAAL